MKKENIKKQLSIYLSFALLLSLFYTVSPATPAQAEEVNSYGLSNPRIGSDGVVTWDCIYFGNYWQNDTNKDGWADETDEKQPIKWRVLSINGDDAFLLADQILDHHEYNHHEYNNVFPTDPVTWETSTLRKWLNDYFYKNAFDSVEQDLIQTTNVINENNPYWGTKGGNNTTDKIFLLSLNEVRNTAYGFNPTYDIESETKTAIDTIFAKYGGHSYYMDEWWLRTIGRGSDAAWVYPTNSSSSVAGTSQTSSYELGIRPVLHLNLKATSNALSAQWCKAGTVSSPGAKVVQPTTYSVGDSANLKNPRTDDNGVTTWDCIYFGNYWQNDTNGDGVADKNDEKQPIKWRVLSINEDDAFLLADQNLDCEYYNLSSLASNVTWENCQLRGWLNGDFYWNAFNNAEQKAILTTTNINKNNPTYGTKGGNNTSEKIYLLSIAEASNPAYGFNHTYDTDSETRIAKNTEYAKKTIILINNKPKINGDSWFLRTLGFLAPDPSPIEVGPPYASTYASEVFESGYISDFGNCSSGSIRPALHLDLKASTTTTYSQWGQAGTVSATGADIKEKTESLSTSKKSKTRKKSKTTAVSIRYAKNKKGRKLFISWKKRTGAAGYQINYASNKRFQRAKKKLTKKTSYTLKKLKKKKNYYIRVRAYKLNGKKKVYGKWSKVKKVKIKK